METLVALAMLLESDQPLPQSRPRQQIAEVCFSSGEQISGLNKICYYDCPSGSIAINVKSYELCPLNIDN